MFSVSSLASPAPLLLSADTVFIHSLTWFHLTSTKSVLDDSFELRIAFRVVSSSEFGVQVYAKYPVQVDQVDFASVTVFIYNKLDFSNLYIVMDYKVITFINLAVGSSSISMIYTATYIPATTNSIVYGINGF